MAGEASIPTSLVIQCQNLRETKKREEIILRYSDRQAAKTPDKLTASCSMILLEISSARVFGGPRIHSARKLSAGTVRGPSVVTER